VRLNREEFNVICRAAWWATVLLLAISAAIIAHGQTPPKGSANPHVAQANIATTICKAGWTATIRPTPHYTDKVKAEQMAAQHLTGKPSDYEEDHFISLDVGGHPTDPDNLWPQPYAGQFGARVKDQVEDELHRRVCAGTMQLAEAQNCIRTDWIACGVKIGKITKDGKVITKGAAK
jgi:hypothetical protein